MMLARYAELTAPGPRPIHPVARVFSERMAQAFNKRDWDAYGSTMSPDIRVRDLRHGGDHEYRGIDEVLSFPKGAIDGMPGAQMTLETLAAEILAGGLRVSAERQAYRDGEQEVRAGVVFVVRDWLLVRADVVEGDDAELLARYDAAKAELLGVAAAEEVEFSPFHRAIFTAWSEAFSSKDGAWMARVYAPDIIDRDHRPGVRDDHYGRDAVVSLLQSVAAFDVVTLDWEPIAIVSPQIIAARLRLTGAGAHGVEFEAISDQVLALDEVGRAVVCDRYEPEQRDELLRRLEELERDGPPSPLVVRLRHRFAEAFNARDWQAVAATYREDIRTADHRSLSALSAKSGREGMLEAVQGVVEVAPDARWSFEPLVVRAERWALSVDVFSGTDEHGGPFLREYLSVVEVDETGAEAVLELFDRDDEAAARARLDELAGPHAIVLGPLAEPGATADVVTRWVAAHNRHDLDAVADIVADDFH